MLVTRNSAMGTKDSDSLHEKGHACGLLPKKRKGNVANTVLSSKERARLEDNKVLMAAQKRPALKKGHTKHLIRQDAPQDKLVKIELDAAHALAEFSRIAYLPVQEDNGGEHGAASLQWSGKRKRSMKPSREKENDASLFEHKMPKKSFTNPNVSAQQNQYVSDEDKGNHLTRDELENHTMPESSKESLPSDSRAESPSSPLPSLPLECGRILVGRPDASSAFQRVVRPVRKSCSLPIKPKIEDIYVDDPGMSVVPAAVPARKMAVKRKPRFCNSAISAASVKLEPLVATQSFRSSDQQKQELASKEDVKDITYQSLTVAESAAPQVVEPTGQGLRVKGKHKPALTENEKEARKLRRIHANRESARQTIRKKQILCEELTRKSASLALENQDMKQKKEEMMQHLQFLKDQNCLLKQQLVMQQDMGHDSFLRSSRLPLKPISSTSVQVSALPCAGVPRQSLVWALAVTEATGGNQACMGKNGVIMSAREHYTGTAARNSSGSGLEPGRSRHNQSPAFLLCQSARVDASDKVSTSGFMEQQNIENSNDSSSPIPVSLAPKQRSPVSGETSAVQSTGVPCEFPEFGCDRRVLDARDSQQGSESANDAGFLPTIQGRGVSSQPAAALPTSSFKSQASTSDLDEACGSLMASGNLGHGFAIPRALSSYGIPSNGSRTVVTLEGSLQMSSFAGKQISAAAIAAAEARRRRKELTRRKFWHSRTFRRHW